MAEIVNNSDHIETTITLPLDRGKRHGVSPKMGVIAPNGIAGIVVNTTNKLRFEYNLF